jgi:hypothetical protein
MIPFWASYVACYRALVESEHGKDEVARDEFWDRIVHLSKDRVVDVRIGVARLLGVICGERHCSENHDIYSDFPSLSQILPRTRVPLCVFIRDRPPAWSRPLARRTRIRRLSARTYRLAPKQPYRSGTCDSPRHVCHLLAPATEDPAAERDGGGDERSWRRRGFTYGPGCAGRSDARQLALSPRA